ncbi:unnamed protein product [Arabidopsis arenosa]|uniref:F-box family protein n=1 Tax=Arabidopsis arenosa TaxID=38785 RepID=A0A8S2B0Q3_ARAAE|nr:unnamed protein product [Arabidopsis arenosa]
MCGKSICALVDSEQTWLVQCEVAKVIPLFEIVQWRIGISSYKALCRFLVEVVEVVKPLVGIWVQKNPEQGNVVYMMPGFLSVVGCRIIPQEVGPLWIQEGQLVWSPVFEIICRFDGSSGFFLHGRDKEGSCLYPGFVMGIEKSCNELLLEVEPRREKSSSNEIEREDSRKELSGKINEGGVPFGNLGFSDRRSLLDIVANHVSLRVGEPLRGKLFPTRSKDDDEAMMLERRTMLLKMLKFGGNWKHMNLEEDDQLYYNPMQVDINEIWENLGDNTDIMDDREYQREATPRKKSFSMFFISGIMHILGKSSPEENTPRPSSSEIRRSNRQTFLSSGDTFSLSLKASYTEMSSYQRWPIMSQNRFSLHKLPMKNPINNQEYAGLWGGTFGWPPGQCREDKSRKALFLLMLTYKESEENSERVLIGTKILEGRLVRRPNGSAMFVVKIDRPSLEPFPFDAVGRDIEDSYMGDGIADGYGFRYPGSKPGSLFVISSDLLAFVWQETKNVITLQRLNLAEILKKGLGSCVPPLSPTNNFNFTYMKRSFGNVFTESSTDI